MDFTKIFLLIRQSFYFKDPDFQRVFCPSTIFRRHQCFSKTSDPLIPLPLVLTGEVSGGVGGGVRDREPVVLKEDKVSVVTWMTCNDPPARTHCVTLIKMSPSGISVSRTPQCLPKPIKCHQFYFELVLQHTKA